MGPISQFVGAWAMKVREQGNDGCYIRRWNSSGLISVPYQASSLSEAVQYEPLEGVYTVSNTDNSGRVLRLNAHLDRLEESAQGAGIALQLDREGLRVALREMLAASGFAAARFRITVPKQQSDTLILSLEEFRPTPHLYEEGVRVVTLPDSARYAAYIKANDWMHKRQWIAKAQSRGIYEVILLDTAGRMLEGLGSNFYAIVAGQLWTAGEGILRGIAQSIVLEIAPTILPLRRVSISLEQRSAMQEAFLTSSSRGIIPIVEVDGEKVGDGRRGPLTRKLQMAYDERTAAEKEPL